MPVFDQERVDKLKQILKWHPRGITISDLSARLEMNRNLVAKYLDILLISGQVEMQVIGASKVYFLSQRIPVTSMLEFSSDMVIILDSAQKIIHVNEPLIVQVHKQREILTGRNIREIDHPFFTAIPAITLSKDTPPATDTVREFDCSVDGKKQYYRLKQLPTAFEDGSHGTTLIIEEITEQITYRRMLEINEAKYRGIVEDQTEFITRFRPDGTLIFVNDAYTRYLGRNKDKIIGKQHIPDIEADEISTVVQCIRSLDTVTPVKTFECRIHHPSGQTRWNLWTLRAIFDDNNKPVEYQGVGRDNTEKREAATRINQYVRDLEFLSRKSQEFVEISAKADIFQFIAQSLFEIVPASLITVNSFDIGSDSITVKAVLPEQGQEFLGKCLGSDFCGFRFNISRMPEEVKKRFVSALMAGKLVKVKENLFDIFFRHIPQDACDRIKQELNLGDSIYTIGLARHGIVFGNVTFSLRQGETISNSSIIETFIRQGSVVLHRRYTEESLKKSEKLYRSVIENIQDVFYRTDTEGSLIMASPSWAHLLGYGTLDNCIGYNIAEKFYYEPLRRKEFLDAVYTNGSVSDYEVVLKSRDGRPVYVSTNSHLYYGDAGELLGVEGIFRDISERHAAMKRMHDHLEEMDFFSRKLQEFIEISPKSDIFYAIGAGFHEILPDTVISVNSFDPGSNTLTVRAIFSKHDQELLKKIVGKEIIGMTIPVTDKELADNATTGKVYPVVKSHFAVLFEPPAPDMFTRIENSLNIGDSYSIGLYWHGKLLGTIIFALRKGDAIAQVPLIETFARAASIALQRKYAEDALKESEEIFSSIAHYAPVPIAIIEKDGTYRYINQKFTEIFGYDIHDFRTGEEWFALAYPDPEYRKKVIEAWKTDLKEYKSGIERPRRFIVRCKNGIDREIVFRPVTLASMKQFVVYEEILEGRESEQRQELLSKVVDAASDAIIGEKTDGTILSWNRGATELFGYSTEEALGQNISLFIPQEYAEEYTRARNQSTSDKTVIKHRIHLVKKDGRVIAVDVTFATVTDESGKGISQFTVARNISPENPEKPQNGDQKSPVVTDEKRIGDRHSDTGNTGADVAVIKASANLHHFHLSNALKLARDYIAILDSTGKCLWVNDALVGAVHAAGCHDMEGKSIALYIAPEFRKIALDTLMEIKKNGNKTLQMMMLSSFGRVPVEANFSAINTEEGSLFGYMAIARAVERNKGEKFKR